MIEYLDINESLSIGDLASKINEMIDKLNILDSLKHAHDNTVIVKTTIEDNKPIEREIDWQQVYTTPKEDIDYIEESTSECKNENKTTKLDEAQKYNYTSYHVAYLQNKDIDVLMSNLSDDVLITRKDFDNIKKLYESAIQEIIQQYESKIYSLQAEVIDEANEVVKLKLQKDEAISAYQITVGNLVDENEKLKQQKPQIDDDLIDWLNEMVWSTKNEVMAERLLKQIKPMY